MYYKIKTGLSMVMVMALAAACASLDSAGTFDNGASVIAGQSETRLSFTEALDNSDCVAIAEFVSYKDKEGFIEYEFKTVDVLRGEAEDTVHLFSMKGASEVEGSAYAHEIGKSGAYKAGEQYILVMEKSDLIFYDYPHYVLAADIHIPLTDIGKSAMYGEPLPGVPKNNSAGYIAELVSQAKKPVKKESYANYTVAEDISAIAKDSDYILKIKVTGVMSEGALHNGSTYYCDALKIIKGGALVRLEKRDDILITFIKGSVKVGETYIAMVNRVSGNSAIYTQSSKRSVIAPSDGEAVKAIESAL